MTVTAAGFHDGPYPSDRDVNFGGMADPHGLDRTYVFSRLAEACMRTATKWSRERENCSG